MNSKLTLSISQSVIEEAKNYAKSNGSSLSVIVEEYLKSLSAVEAKDEKSEALKTLRELQGSVKLPNDERSYKALLQDALIEKYLGR